jgi:KDO2-lipid IV(A) lauroyltransferase
MVSPRRLRKAGTLLGRIAFHVARRARRIAEENVARVFPELDPAARRALVLRNFENLGGLLGEVATLTSGRPLPSLSVGEGAGELLDAMAESGRGVLLVSAHLGNWERVAHALVGRGLPLTTIAREAYDPRFLPWYARVRGPVEVIYRGAAGASTRIVRVLRRGRVLGIPMDLRSRVASAPVAFLGHAAPTPIGPARLALRTGARVVVVTLAPTARSEHPFEITATPIETGDLAAGQDGELRLTERLNDELSARIRQMPDAWLWPHERW